MSKKQNVKRGSNSRSPRFLRLQLSKNYQAVRLPKPMGAFGERRAPSLSLSAPACTSHENIGMTCTGQNVIRCVSQSVSQRDSLQKIVTREGKKYRPLKSVWSSHMLSPTS